MERQRQFRWVGADGADHDGLRGPSPASLVDYVGTHQQIVEIQVGRLRLVRPDPSHTGGEVEDEIGLVGEEGADRVPVGEVVVRRRGRGDLRRSAALQAAHRGTQEASRPGQQDALAGPEVTHRRSGGDWKGLGSIRRRPAPPSCGVGNRMPLGRTSVPPRPARVRAASLTRHDNHRESQVLLGLGTPTGMRLASTSTSRARQRGPVLGSLLGKYGLSNVEGVARAVLRHRGVDPREVRQIVIEVRDGPQPT